MPTVASCTHGQGEWRGVSRLAGLGGAVASTEYGDHPKCSVRPGAKRIGGTEMGHVGLPGARRKVATRHGWRRAERVEAWLESVPGSQWEQDEVRDEWIGQGRLGRFTGRTKNSCIARGRAARCRCAGGVLSRFGIGWREERSRQVRERET
jgi:hypothetical protein